MVTLAAKALVGATILGGVALCPVGTAPAAAASCGAPHEAPGFETPATGDVVPEMLCMDLQLAQDKAQAAGFRRVLTQDDSGQGRRQVYDREWVVVAQSPPSGTHAPRARVELRVLAYGDPGAPPIPNRNQPGPIPNLVCFDLQEAQDTLESAGFYETTSQDASGRRRRQFIDRNWTVTNQSPPAGGTHQKTTRVTLDVLKDREPSPC